MKTLKELNEKAWYRLIKVFYVLLYIPYLFLLIFAYDAGRDVHPPVYPDAIEVALNDPEFYKLSDFDKRNVLIAIDNDFKDLDYGEQNQFIENIKQIDIKTKEIVKPKRVVMEKVTDAKAKRAFGMGKIFSPLIALRKLSPMARRWDTTVKKLALSSQTRQKGRLRKVRIGLLRCLQLIVKSLSHRRKREGSISMLLITHGISGEPFLIRL
jgi:hypothetical protein